MYYLFSVRNFLLVCLAGAAAGMGAVRLYEGMPASWVCDAGEEIRSAHMPVLRKHGRAAGTGCAAAALCVLFSCLSDGLICLPAAASLVLILISLAAASQTDLTYLIIPDQISAFILTAGFFCVICETCIPAVPFFHLPAEPSLQTIVPQILPDTLTAAPQAAFQQIFPDNPVSAPSGTLTAAAEKLLFRRSQLSFSCTSASARFSAAWPDFLSALRFSLCGVLCGGLTLLLCSVVSLLCSGRQSIGMGDIKLTGACGACLGPEQTFVLISLTSLGTAMASLFSQSSDPDSRVQPAAPWIFLSFVLCRLFSG